MSMRCYLFCPLFLSNKFRIPDFCALYDAAYCVAVNSQTVRCFAVVEVALLQYGQDIHLLQFVHGFR